MGGIFRPWSQRGRRRGRGMSPRMQSPYGFRGQAARFSGIRSPSRSMYTLTEFYWHRCAPVILITGCKRSNTAIRERDAPLGKSPGVRIDCRGGSACSAAYKTAARSLHTWAQVRGGSAGESSTAGPWLGRWREVRQWTGRSGIGWHGFFSTTARGDLPIDFPTTCPPLMAPGG